MTTTTNNITFSDIVEQERADWIDRFFISLPSQQEVLLRAYELIESGWCKGRYHLTPEEQNRKSQYGFVVDYNNTNVDRYCLVGAIRQAVYDVGYQGNIALIIERIRVASGLKEQVSTWNDQPQRTKSEVLSVIDRAICLAVSDN